MINPILKDFPAHFETERLLVRCPQSGDGVAMFEAIVESRAELVPWMAWASKNQHVDETEEYVRRAQANWLMRTALPMLVYRKSDGSFVGGSGLHHIEWDVPAFEIGYWQRTKCRGQGYITEAVNGLTAFCREVLGARRIVIRCDTLNTRSKRVAERAGFALEATVRSTYREPGGQLRDDFVFSKTWPD